jgi:predicted ATPase
LAFLRPRQLLLILDNAEQIPEAGGVVRELLQAAPRLKCLVTSQRTLEIGPEQLAEVAPLPPAEAEALFVERARARQSAFALTAENASDVAELCRRLEGVPLALELAASRIAGMTPRQILGRLAERFRLLQTRAPDVPVRQRALRAAIDWSYSLLSPEDQAVFAQLAVFAGGFTLEDAEAVCDAPDVLESVMELRRHSLFRSETDPATQATRFVMLVALREYAMEKLAEAADGGAGARERHARHFLAFAQERLRQLRTPGEPTALRQLEESGDNLRAAHEWATDAGHAALAAELALALGIFTGRRGFLHQAGEWVQNGLAIAAPLRESHPDLCARLLYERAGLLVDLGGSLTPEEAAEARTRAAEALALFERVEDAVGQARVENLLGRTALGEEDYPTAREHFQRALEQFEQAGDDLNAAVVHNNLGIVDRRDRAGDKERGARHLEEALRLRRARDDRRGMAETLNNLGVLAQYQKEWDTAWSRYAEALGYVQELGHPLGVAIELCNLGEVGRAQERHEEALRLLAAAERLMDEVESEHWSGYVREQLQEAASGAGWDASRLAGLRQAARNQPAASLVAWALGDAPLPAVPHTP